MSIRSKALALGVLLAAFVGFAHGDGIQNGGTTAGGVVLACGAANNQLLWDNAGACAGLTTANSGVVITSAGGAPSVSATLPSSLIIPSPTLSGTVAGNLTFSGNLTFNGTASVGNGSLSVGGNAMTFPGAPDTLAGLGTIETWTANQSFNSGTFLLKGASSGTLTVKPAAAAGSNTLTLPAGTTDFSATGGASQVVKQASAGAALTVGQLACADLSNGAASCSTDATNAANIASGTLPPARLNGLNVITNSLSGDVAMNNIANYFDGPSVAQGATGTWFASGTVTVASVASDFVWCKLWDGTTVIASVATSALTETMSLTLSGSLATPAGNLRISCRDPTHNSGVIKFNTTGNSLDSTITAFRIN
jgi:hypothetical protein